MPKKTFFNLTEEKKSRIIEAAMTEFASYSFKKATIDNIVNHAGIPKGSFYQYFYDKKDIYKYLFEKLSQEKKAVLQESLEQMNDVPFTTFIRQWYLAGVKFNLASEQRLDLSQQFLLNCSTELREEILEIMIPDSNALFAEVITHYIQKGELKESVNVSSLSNILTTLTIFIGKNHHAMEMDSDQVIADIHSMLDIIEHGILKEES